MRIKSIIKAHSLGALFFFAILIFANISFSEIDITRIDGTYNIKLGMPLDSVMPKLRHSSKPEFKGNYIRLFAGNPFSDPEELTNHYYFFNNKLYEFSARPSPSGTNDIKIFLDKMVKHFGNYVTRIKSIDSVAACYNGTAHRWKLYEWKDNRFNTGVIFITPDDEKATNLFGSKLIFLDYNSKAIFDESGYYRR